MKATLLVLLSILLMPAANAADVPAAFGTGHDNPRTAYPSPLPGDAAAPCIVEVLRHSFAGPAPAQARVDPSAQCPGPWHQVIVRLDGAVKGRQYDRIGEFKLGGVTLLKTSTPEPSREGIEWRVDKDVTAYLPLFSREQPAELVMENYVDKVHDGVIHLRVSLLFFRADAQRAPARTADLVLPLQGIERVGSDAVGRLSIPANSERVVAEVYATGSGGGCEEFWYMAAPPEGFWCRSAQGPYREVEVLLDGRLAGIAAPYPYIYTGGWSNPFLWYTIPAPRAFDIPPLRFELTPFIGLLNDGRPHELRIRVKGLDAGKPGWTLLPHVLVWRDAGVARTRGRLLDSTAGDPRLESWLDDRADPGDQSLRFRSERSFRARGYVEGSRGRTETTVEREIRNDSHHRWTSQEDGDDHLTADWLDRERITRRGKESVSETHEQRYGIEGTLSTVLVGGKPRVTTTMRIHDDGERAVSRDGKAGSIRRTRDRFAGSASYTRDVPREERNAVAETRQSFRVETDGQCWQRVLATRNGRFITDETGCGKPREAAGAGR